MTKKSDTLTPEPRRVPLSAGAALRLDALFRQAEAIRAAIDHEVSEIVTAAGHKGSGGWFMEVRGDAAELVEAKPDGR